MSDVGIIERRRKAGRKEGEEKRGGEWDKLGRGVQYGRGPPSGRRDEETLPDKNGGQGTLHFFLKPHT